MVTGTPGSGKSSVARALVGHYPRGIHVPVDDLREWVVSGIVSPIEPWSDETSRQFTLARRSAAAVARMYADAGFAVAIDDVIFPEEVEDLFVAPLAGHDVRKVLLRPRLDVALERNANRASKPFDPSILVATIRDLHQAMARQPFAECGWTIVDTSDLDVEETVSAILA